MITAEKARSISLLNRMPYIEELIKKAANKGFHSVSLNGDLFLTADEKEILIKLGYTVSFGQSGKHGIFHIIHW